MHPDRLMYSRADTSLQYIGSLLYIVVNCYNFANTSTSFHIILSSYWNYERVHYKRDWCIIYSVSLRWALSHIILICQRSGQKNGPRRQLTEYWFCYWSSWRRIVPTLSIPTCNLLGMYSRLCTSWRPVSAAVPPAIQCAFSPISQVEQILPLAHLTAKADEGIDQSV